jgi:hypothetical protein
MTQLATMEIVEPWYQSMQPHVGPPQHSSLVAADPPAGEPPVAVAQPRNPPPAARRPTAAQLAGGHRSSRRRTAGRRCAASQSSAGQPRRRSSRGRVCAGCVCGVPRTMRCGAVLARRGVAAVRSRHRWSRRLGFVRGRGRGRMGKTDRVCLGSVAV